MKYSMKCPIEGCSHVMSAEADDKDTAATMLIKAGDDHFAEASHEVGEAMDPAMKLEMTKKFMTEETI